MATDPPPGNLLQVPTTVVVNDVTENEVDPAAWATLGTMGVIASGIIEHFFGIRAASIIDSSAVMTGILTGNWDKMMTLVGNFFRAAQGEQNSGFYDLCAAVLEDLTGVKVDAAALKQSTFGSGRLAGMKTFGGDLYDLLESEFKPASGNLETPSADAAKTFLGFLMNFAIRQGNVAAMCEAMPQELKFLTGFRDYGEMMAKSLGLGRMAARSLRPLPQVLVADPLTRYLNAEYRPKRLDVMQAIKAYFRQSITQDQLRSELAQAGYSDDRQNFLVGDARPLLNDRELVHLYFRNQLDLDPLTTELKARGWAEAAITYLIESERPQMSAQEVLDAFLYGGLPETDVLSELGKLGYDVSTASKILAGFKARHDPTQRPQRAIVRHRTPMQLRKEFLDGVIDLIEWNTALIQLGYSDDDISAMTEDLLVDQAHRKTTGAAHAIPHLTWAQLKEAYKVGILDLTAVTDHLKARGYTQEDLDALLKELPAPPPPPVSPGP